MPKSSAKRMPWKFLALLVLVAVISIWFYGNLGQTILLMVLAYASNASYAMQSRSGTRNSGSYHAFTILISNLFFYQVLHQLVESDLSLALFIPYTVATVWGSVTGAKTSMKIEERFGITTDTTRREPTTRAVYAKRILMVLLGVGTIVIGIWKGSLFTFLSLSALIFADSMTHSWLRRARNTSSAWYHVGISLLKSAVWFFLFKNLAQSGMPLELFIPYSFGSVLGGVAGQETSMWIERLIGADADSHLKNRSMKIIPWNTVIFLGIVVIISVTFALDEIHAIILVLLAMGQQVSFSLVSRSRNRSSLMYHVIASIFSNGVWFLTFRHINVGNWTLDLYVPYAAGSALGSVAGVSTSMGIERKLNIKSD